MKKDKKEVVSDKEPYCPACIDGNEMCLARTDIINAALDIAETLRDEDFRARFAEMLLERLVTQRTHHNHF